MKVLIYCTMAKPYLHQDHSNGVWFVNNEKTHNGFCGYDEAKNGSVCFECDCKEAKQLYIYESESPDDEFHSFGNCDFVKENFRRMGLSGDAESTGNILDKYGNYWLYFYHFENVKPIYPMPITCLYKDEACTKPLTKAPQSHCFAYRKRLVEESEVNDFIEEGGKAFDSLGRVVRWSTIDGYWVSEKVLVFSIRSPWCCKYGNGKKDLEVRTGRVQNAGIEYK